MLFGGCSQNNYDQPKNESNYTLNETNVIENYTAKYDEEILKQFKTQTEARVIITLLDDSNITVQGGSEEERLERLKEKNVWFSSKSDQILSNFVQDEFRPVGKLSTGFSGFITRKGFDKLIKNPMVESIHISLPVYATNN